MKRHFLTTLAFAAALGVLAVPAKRKPFVFRQPDGTELIVTLVGDEFEHYYLTAEGDTLTPLTPLYPPERGEGVSYVLVPKREAPLQAVLEEKQRAQRGAELRAMRNAELRAQRGTQSSSNHLPPFGGNEGGQEGPLGSPRELVLLVEYPDCRFTYPAETLRRMLCEEGFSDDGATGSARDYFSDQSRGLFTPDIEVVGPIMLPHPRAYYGTPTANMYDGQPWLMLTDAAPLVDEEVDFAQFDNDADGFVDNVFIFYAGQGQNDGGPLEAVWPHAANIWTYYGLDCTLDGVRLGSYACTNEVTATGRMTGIGTFCHEYSHVLGLPDLYSTLSAADCFSPGAFELMDSGSYNNEGRTPPNMSAYDRVALGWVMPEPLTAPETVVMAPTAPTPPTAPLQLPPLGGGLEGAERGEGLEGAESLGQMLQEPPFGGYWGGVRSIATVKPEEYYLLENRQQVGWDAFLPGHGMLIWHIDYDARAWADNQVNVLAGHQRVDLVEADGLLTKETQDGDPFPGARQTTAVNLLPWTGVPIDAAITEIREVPSADTPGTGVVTFKFRGGGERIEAPVALAAEEVGPCGFTASWTGVPAITDYEVVVWRGQEALPLNVAAEQPRTEPSSGRWTATVGGLDPATTYRYGVVALDGERRSPVSNEVAFTTLPPTFDMLAPTDLAAEPCTMGEGSDGGSGSGNGDGGSGNGGSGSGGSGNGNGGSGSGNGGSGSEGGGSGAAAWRLTWTGLEEAVAYEVEVYGHQQVAPEVVTLDFTGGLAALPEGWTTTSTQTSGVAGTFGAARPALMLQAGEWLQSPAFEAPIGDYSFWSKGDAAATLLGGDRQLRIANMGETTAYVDDVVVSYGGRTEQVGTVVYSTTDKTAWGGDPAGAMLVVPARDGALWWRVRGVRADGVRSAWSAEAALPLLEGIADVRMAAPGSGVRYVIPPFITISADGTKRRQ